MDNAMEGKEKKAMMPPHRFRDDCGFVEEGGAKIRNRFSRWPAFQYWSLYILSWHVLGLQPYYVYRTIYISSPSIVDTNIHRLPFGPRIFCVVDGGWRSPICERKKSTMTKSLKKRLQRVPQCDVSFIGFSAINLSGLIVNNHASEEEESRWRWSRCYACSSFRPSEEHIDNGIWYVFCLFLFVPTTIDGDEIAHLLGYLEPFCFSFSFGKMFADGQRSFLFHLSTKVSKNEKTWFSFCESFSVSRTAECRKIYVDQYVGGCNTCRSCQLCKPNPYPLYFGTVPSIGTSEQIVWPHLFPFSSTHFVALLYYWSECRPMHRTG